VWQNITSDPAHSKVNFGSIVKQYFLSSVDVEFVTPGAKIELQRYNRAAGNH
jgi:hypothetical protein